MTPFTLSSRVTCIPQAVLLAAAFLRHVLTPGGGGEWPVLSSRYMLLGRSNTGVKLVANAGFPWLEQVGACPGGELCGMGQP